MANDGNDQILIKIAVFGITFSMLATMGIAVLWNGGGDYNYDEIQGYRDDLISFSGESMINQSPWVLTHVYTPWEQGMPVEGHMDSNGWLYGKEILRDDPSTEDDDDEPHFPDIGKSANIRLDPNQKSTVPITVNTELKPEYEYEDGYRWWADGWWSFYTRPIGEYILGYDPHLYSTGYASVWNFTGYRYVFDPTLPFKQEQTVSHVDDALSVVWYNYGGQEGLAGGLQIYDGRVLLASYSASDIIADYQSTSGYATTYDFVFDNTHLTLSILFDQDVIDNGTPLMEAFTTGKWTMAISSLSAGNFFDIENSISFTSTAGSMIDTFVRIFTFDMPNVTNPWAEAIMWLMVGLPMTLAMLCITLRLVSGFKVI